MQPTAADALGTGRSLGVTVRAQRLARGLSLNQLARRAGVDPAYMYRIESLGQARPPVPRRAVVLAIAAALELDGFGADDLLVAAGYAPEALLRLGGWDPSLATVAELLTDAANDEAARADLRAIVATLARRWARGTAPPNHPPDTGTL